MARIDALFNHEGQPMNLYFQAFESATSYLRTVDQRDVFPSADAIAKLAQLDEPFPEQSSDDFDIIADLHEIGSPATVAQGGGRYFGFVNGGVFPVSLAARWLADAWDQNAALHVISPIASKLEQLCESWVVDLLGLPTGTAAGFVSGTSTATMCGLLVGRNELLKKQGWDVREQGLFGAPPIRVVMSEQSHATVRKALGIIGIGRSQVEIVPADAQGRFDATQCPPLDDNTLLILQAGNVNTGAFDDFTTLCTKANGAGAWVHVDGAFGLWAAGCEETSYLTEGVESADSWSLDPHKTLNAPYDSGIVLCKDRTAMTSALHASGSYIIYGEERDGMHYTPEMSRRARGVELWALLKSLGRRGVDQLIAQLCNRAKLFGGELEKHGFRVLNDVVFNQVLVACDSAEQTTATLKQIQAGGVCWCGGSQWNGEPVIRISVCSHVTTEEDVMRSVQAFVDARKKSC